MEPEGPVEQYNTKNPLIFISGLLYFIYYFCTFASINFTFCVFLFCSFLFSFTQKAQKTEKNGNQRNKDQKTNKKQDTKSKTDFMLDFCTLLFRKNCVSHKKLIYVLKKRKTEYSNNIRE